MIFFELSWLNCIAKQMIAFDACLAKMNAYYSAGEYDTYNLKP